MHEVLLKDAISTCVKRVFAKLLTSPAHTDALSTFLRSNKEHTEQGGAAGGGDVKRESTQDQDMRDTADEQGGYKKRGRGSEGTDVGTNKRQSSKGISQNAKSSRSADFAEDAQINVMFTDMLTAFLLSCFKSKRALACGGDDIQCRGLIIAMLIVAEFACEGEKIVKMQGVQMPPSMKKTLFHFLPVVSAQPGAIAKMAANGNFMLWLEALRNLSRFNKTTPAINQQMSNIMGGCIEVCAPLVAGAASGSNHQSRAMLVEMVSTLSSSTRLPTSTVPIDFFREVLQSSDDIVASAGLRHLPAFVLRCPAAAACAKDWVSLLHSRLETSSTSSGIKKLIPRTLAHLLCGVCALQSCNGDAERAIKCEVLPSMDACDPVEQFAAKQGLFSQLHGAGSVAVRGIEEIVEREAHQGPKGVWCCGDRCGMRYGSAQHGSTLPLPFLAPKGSVGDRGKQSVSPQGQDSKTVQKLAHSIFESFRVVLEQNVEYKEETSEVLRSVLWALPLVVLHLPTHNLESENWLLDYCLDIVSGPKYNLGVRSCAAAAMAGMASGSGGWLTATSGHESFCKACDKVLAKVRDVYANLKLDSDSEYKAAGCIQVEAFMGALIDDRNQNEGTGDILKIICTDLVMTAVQNLADGNFRKSCGAYGALDFVACGRSLTIDGLLSHSNCREDITVHMIKCMGGGAEGAAGGVGGEGRPDVRMIKAYVNLFGDGTGKGVGDDDECCKQFLETIFKDIAHKLLMEDDGQQINCVAAYLQMEPSELIANNVQYIIRNLCFVDAKTEDKTKVDKARRMIKQYIGMDAVEVTREMPVCYDYLLRQVLWEVSQYTKDVDKSSGREMIRKLCRWLSSEKGHENTKADRRPLEVILSIDKHQDFYTKWMFELNRECFEDTKLTSDSAAICKKRLQVLMVMDFTIPLLGKILDQMLAVILSTLNKAKLVEDLKEKVCDVWYTLISNCGVASKTLQSRLPQIVITLLQLGAKYPNKVKPSLQLLLVEWRHELGSEYKKIPEVSSKIEDLKEFTDFLTAERVKQSDRLPSMLRLSIDGIKSEDDDLQIEHLTTLKTGIQMHFQAVMQTLSGFTSKDLETEGKDKLGELIRLLLAKCTHTNFRVRNEAVKCLGQLGAIEPSRIPPMERLMQNSEKSDDDLAIDILNDHLVRLLMGSSKKHSKASPQQGIVELAIQELLKFLEIDKIKESIASPAKIFRQASTQFPMSQHQPPAQTGSKRGQENWAKVQHKSIILPWLFTTLESHEGPNEPKQSVFRPGLHYGTWVRLFCYEVVMRCKGSRGELLGKIHKMLKKDYDLANFVLSPAVLHLICSGDDSDIEFICNELMSVLNHAFDSGKFDEGDVIEMMGAGSFKLKSTGIPPNPDELLGMELKLELSSSISESRNICLTHQDRERLTVVNVQPPFSDAVSLQAPIKYSVSKGMCSGSHHDKIEGNTQVVFKILDDLTGLCEHYSRAVASTGRRCPEEVHHKKNSLVRFLKRIPRLILAKASCQCAAYDRALFYLEDSIREQWHINNHRARGDISQPPPLAVLLNTLYIESEREQVLSTFHRIYAGLEDDDGLVGITKLRKEISLDEKIKTCELGGDWNQALSCYEQALKQSPCATRYIDYLQCLRNLGHMQAMLTQSQGEIRNYPFHAHEFRASALQASWRLGRWDLVEEHLDAAVRNADFGTKMPFESRLASVLLAMHEGDKQAATAGLSPLSQCVMGPLAAASIESYQRAYPHMIRLHMINEIERSFRVIFPSAQMTEGSRRVEMAKLCDEWNMRLELTQPSMGEREPLLALRRSLFAMMGARTCVADGWLEFAKAARRAGHASTANSAILQAESFGAPMAFLEHTKLQWCHEHERHQALNSLRCCIDRQLQQHAATNGQGAGAALKSIVLYWKWVQEIGLQQTSEVITGFVGDLSKLGPKVTNIEKIHFMLGQLYESLAFPHRHARPDERHGGSSRVSASTTQPKELTYLAKILEEYGESLKCGHKHIFQSLPRLLTLWFENSDRVDPQTQRAMHSVIGRLTTELPSYIWLSVYPQLISRICHPNLQVLDILKNIISRVLAKHPRQSLWALASVIRSREESRTRPAKAILAKLNHLGVYDGDNAAKCDFLAAKRAFLGSAEESGGFAGELVNLCRITVGKDSSQDKKRVYTMSKDCRSLVRTVRDSQNQVLMPVELMLVPNLPRDGRTDQNHRPFPADEIYIEGFGEQIDVMASMMSPVKVVFKGSDGKEYKFLAKPKDDLRKDTRMMEFNTMINRLLLKDADARRRNLHLRTFTVIPMNESTGIIQWVDNTEVFRSIIDKQVVKLMNKTYHNTNFARSLFKTLPVDGQLTLEVYKSLTTVYHPVFHRWFQETFSDPATWTAARNTYVRTTAAWSMVGYVVGLGDRHTENILFDSTSGACVHVDFACMFNKGETLKIAERVPFRLTHNMVDAMGVSGYGGGYERTCCNTMRVLRANRDALMNVLETCVHDPLTEFVRKGEDAKDRSCFTLS